MALDNPDATKEEIEEQRQLAIQNLEHWATGPEDYPEDAYFAFYEIDDRYRIVGPSPGRVTGN